MQIFSLRKSLNHIINLHLLVQLIYTRLSNGAVSVYAKIYLQKIHLARLIDLTNYRFNKASNCSKMKMPKGNLPSGISYGMAGEVPPLLPLIIRTRAYYLCSCTC